MTTTGRYRSAYVAGMLAAGLFAVACAGGAGGEEAPSSRRAVPVVVDEEPLWRTPANSPQYERSRLHGDSLLILGNTDDPLTQRLAALDVATGAVRWQLDTRNLLPGDGHARLDQQRDGLRPLAVGDSVLVPFTEWCGSNTCVDDPSDTAGYGVMALSARDGTIRWKTSLIPKSEGPSAHHQLLTVDENIALSVNRCCEVDDPATVRIVATRVSDGTTAWESTGSWPQFVADGNVLGVTSNRMPVPGQGGDYLGKGSTVVALDAGTGARKWDLSKRYESSTVSLTLGDVAVIDTLDERTFTTFVVDASTGEEIAELGKSVDGLPCVSDEANLIACRYPGGDTLVTFDVARRKVSVSRPADSLPPLSGAWHGHVLASNRIVDPGGNTVASFPPTSSVSAMSDDYVVVYTADRQEYAVHRVSR